jgi:hypothetical protein
MRSAISLAVMAALGGCVAATPLVKMAGVDPVVYQRDLDRCQSIAPSADAIGPLVVGAIMGASFGMGAGAFAGPSGAISMAEGYGAAAGAGAGAGLYTLANAQPTPPGPPQETRSVADCLRAHGYTVLTGPSQAGG